MKKEENRECKHDETTVDDLFRVITTDRLERVERMLRYLVVKILQKDHYFEDGEGKFCIDEFFEVLPNIDDIIHPASNAVDTEE